MKTENIDLVKIVDEVWKENELHSGTYKVAALTAMQKLQELHESKRTEQQQGELLLAMFDLAQTMPNNLTKADKMKVVNKFISNNCG